MFQNITGVPSSSDAEGPRKRMEESIMADMMLVLTFAACGMMGYWLMGRVDGFFSHHAVGRSEKKREK